MDKADIELKYHEITELYDLGEELVDSVESEYVSDPEAQMTLVEPLVETVGDSADVLCEEFLAVAGGGKKVTRSRKNKVEAAMRKIYAALDEYYQKTRATAEHASGTLLNIADPIVEKVKRQLESIVAIFVDYVQISLDRIMQQSQIEELKQRQQKISSMLYHAGYGMEQG